MTSKYIDDEIKKIERMEKHELACYPNAIENLKELRRIKKLVSTLDRPKNFSLRNQGTER